MAVVRHLIRTHMLKFQGCSVAIEEMNVLNISENQAMYVLGKYRIKYLTTGILIRKTKQNKTFKKIY